MREIMMMDGRLADHQSAEERVLGYLYDYQKDCLKLSPIKCEHEANTKCKSCQGHLNYSIQWAWHCLSLYEVGI